MLIFCLVLISIIVWTTVYSLYFRDKISFWYHNYLGRDEHKVTKDAAPEGVTPIHYGSQKEDEASGS